MITSRLFKRAVGAVMSAALALLPLGPEAGRVHASQRSASKGVSIPNVSLPSVGGKLSVPATALPGTSALPAVEIPSLPQVAAPAAPLASAVPIQPQAAAQAVLAGQKLEQAAQTAVRLSEKAGAAETDRSAADFVDGPARPEGAVPASVPGSLSASAPSGLTKSPLSTRPVPSSTRPVPKKGVERENRSALFPLALAGVSAAATTLLLLASRGLSAATAWVNNGGDGAGLGPTAFHVLAGAAAVVGGVFLLATVLDAAVFLVAMARGRKVTPSEFKKFVAAEVAAGRLDAGVAALIRPHRPEKTLRDLTFGYVQGDGIFLRPELAASPLLFRLVLVHELHHMKIGRERGPPSGGLIKRLWRKVTSELGARTHELRGPNALGRLKVPGIERALRQTQLSLQFDKPYDVLVVNPASEELKQPSLYRALSGGSARVETIVTPSPQEYLGQDKNAGRFKAVVVDRPADLLPAAASAEAKRLSLALQQLDSLFILATRGAAADETSIGFLPGEALGRRFRSLAKQAGSLNRSSKREVHAFEKKIKDLWSQIAAKRLEGLAVADLVGRLYGGLQDRGLAFLTFTPTDPGVQQWERLLRYWEGPDGGKLRVARVDLEDGGHILVVRKVESRVGMWLKPRAGGRIEESVADADGDEPRRAKARAALEQAGFGPQLEEFKKLGVVVEQVFGAQDRRQEIFVTVPRRNAAAIRRYGASQSMSVETSRSDFEPHLVEAGGIHGADKVWAGGVDGSGGTIMVVDTGGDATHEDFGGKLEQLDMVHDGHEDWQGHGTHVLGIAGSRSAKYTGMSKGAALVIAKVFGRDSPGAADGPIMGAGSIARERGVDVVNLSFGSRGSSSDNLAMFFSDLADDGVIVVASAGNAGPFDKSLSQPAAGEHVISVAAAAKSLDDGRPEISFYSSVGPDVDRRYSIPRVRLKPDLTAVGGDVTTRPESPRTYEHGIGSAKSKDMARRADDAEDGRHTYMSGTSMASPMAAGIANLVKQALRKAGVKADSVWNALPRAVRAVLQRTSVDLGAPLWYQGTGLIDAAAAVKLALSGEGWDWLDRLQGVRDLEDSVYKRAELAKTRALSRFEDAAMESETPEGREREAAGNAVYAAVAKGFSEGRAEAVPRLLAALDRTKEPVWLVRFQAALALLNMKSGDSALALAEAALNDPDARVRRMAFHALAELRGRATDVLLQKAADDARPETGMYAAYVLARRGDRSALDRLHKELGSQDKAARFTAVWLLGQLGGQASGAEAEALAARLQDAAERGNIRHLAASALTNVGDAAPDAVTDAVVLGLLDSAGPQNLALTRTISKFFPAALRHKSFGERLRAEPLRQAVTAFIMKHKSQVGRPGALGELVQLFARYLDLPLDFPTPAPDPTGAGVAGVDEAMGRVDLLIEPGPGLKAAGAGVKAFWDQRTGQAAGGLAALAAAGLDAPLLTLREGELRAALPLTQALWVSVSEHKAYALTLELRRLGFIVNRAAALYPQTPNPLAAGGLLVDPSSEAAPVIAADADLSLVRVDAVSGVSEARVLAALEAVRAQAGDTLSRPVVVQLGLAGGAVRREPTAPALTRLVDKLMLENVGVVLPAGNEGPGNRTLASPADSQLAVVVAAAGSSTGLQYYSGRGAPGRPGVHWSEEVDEVSPSSLSADLAEAMVEAVGGPRRGVGTGAAARVSAVKLASLARTFAERMKDEGGRLPDGWFFYVVSLVKSSLRPMPSGAAHEVGGGLFAGEAAAAAAIKAAPDAAARANRLISEARERLAPPVVKAKAKRSLLGALRAVLRRLTLSRLAALVAGPPASASPSAPANGPPDGSEQAAAWWSDPSQTRLAVTAPLYALRREEADPGVGKFADLGRVYEDELSKQGVDAVLLLPHFAVREESPYAPVSLYAVSEDQVDWSELPEARARPELLARLTVTALSERQSVDYAGLRRREQAAAAELWRAFEREQVAAGTERGRAFVEWRAAQAGWLAEYAEFMAFSAVLDKPSAEWTADDLARARLDPRFGELVEQREFAQWLGYGQLRAAVERVHAAGGKVLFDVPMFRAKAGVDAWRRPELFTDLKTRNPGIKNEWINEDWKDLALWNWTRLGRDGYRAALAPYEHWLDFGFDGARVDAFHFAYAFGNGQLASGDEPGDGYTSALAAVFKKRGAFPLAEAFEGKDADAKRLGFVTLYGDWKKVSGHDDPRSPSSFTERVKAAHAQARPGKAARFIGYTLGDEWGDPFPVKELKGGRSLWRWRLPLPSDPDYAARARADARPRLAALKALLGGALWNGAAAVRSALDAAAALFVKNGPRGVELWAASLDWFLEEWGRDAFISLPGVLLSRGKFSEARDVIRRFGALERGGLIPNRIPPDGSEAEYNTIDGPLWFVDAVRSYAQASGDWAFVEEMRPVLRRVLEAYRDGTSYRRYGRENRVFMDADGLIVGPAQATWMDADPEGLDKPVTPRHGKAVEINALWYSSLRFFAEASRRAGDARAASGAAALADRVRLSFNERFWFQTPENAAAWGGAGGALRDVVDGDPHGEAIRPNMLIAVSRGGDLLSPARRRAVVQAAARDLLTPYGLRTLSPRDSNYKPRYETWKKPLEKDQAYHQGTAWPWLMGPFLDALAQVRRDEGWAQERIAAETRQIAEPLTAFLVAGAEGSLPEVFDGGPVLPTLAVASLDDSRGLGPAVAAAVSDQKPGGTRSQAWSVAELLRVLSDK